MHTPGGIRIRDPSRRAATDLRPRSRGHRDRQNRTRDLLACSVVPQPLAPPRTPFLVVVKSLVSLAPSLLSAEFSAVSRGAQGQFVYIRNIVPLFLD